MIAKKTEASKTNWVYVLLILLLIEKTIQHIAVTLAFYFDWGGIRSAVAVNPDILMVLGAFVAALFALSFWGMLTKRKWTVGLVVGLALFDILGEFAAQGKMGVTLTISFIVAMSLLTLILVYRRR